MRYASSAAVPLAKIAGRGLRNALPASCRDLEKRKRGENLTIRYENYHMIEIVICVMIKGMNRMSEILTFEFTGLEKGQILNCSYFRSQMSDQDGIGMKISI